MEAERIFASLLMEVIYKATHAPNDSVGQPMKQIRVALLDKISEELAKHGY